MHRDKDLPRAARRISTIGGIAVIVPDISYGGEYLSVKITGAVQQLDTVNVEKLEHADSSSLDFDFSRDIKNYDLRHLVRPKLFDSYGRCKPISI